MTTSQQPFDRQALIARLRRLPLKGMAAFAVACSSRMVPNFKVFSEEANWGDPEVLEESVRILWRFAESDENLQDQITDLISQCTKQAPDLDEVTTELATWGSDAALAVLYSLMCTQKSSPEHAADAAETAYSTVDAWVQVREDMDPSDPNLERRIAENQTMKREIDFQQKALLMVEEADGVPQGVVAKLQTLWNNGGRSNIDL